MKNVWRKSAKRCRAIICHKDNIDLSESMLEHGWARLHPSYAGFWVTDKRYVIAVQAAKAAEVGLWVQTPPRQNLSTR